MSIWKRDTSIERLNKRRDDSMVEHLGIEVVEIGDNFITASMPVDKRTHQPMGILHGGASIALAETVGSMAANLVVEENQYCVGLEINGNHLKSVRSGSVLAMASPVHIGRSTQVWDIRIRNQEGADICISRLTMAVLNK